MFSTGNPEDLLSADVAALGLADHDVAGLGFVEGAAGQPPLARVRGSPGA